METIANILGVILIAAILAILFAFPTMWLWNWLMPAIFGLTKITFWQALGIDILSEILFKSTSSK
jgi:hypothetical protein